MPPEASSIETVLAEAMPPEASSIETVLAEAMPPEVTPIEAAPENPAERKL